MKDRDNKIQKILRVDLSNGSVQLDDLPEEWNAKYIGCRGVNSRLLFNDVKVGTEPLGPDNVLYFGTGPLDGTPVGQGRISVACKSARGTIIEGSSGGFFGPELRRAGIDYVAIHGKADHPVYLYIEDEKAEIRDASHLWGLKTDDTDAALHQELADPNIQHRYIGPAGENLVHSSPIFGNLHSSGGRGCGQVMGSKMLKAVAVHGSKGIRVADYEAFLDAYKVFRKQLDITTSRDMWSAIWGGYGATVINRLFTDQGGVMTRNAKQMHWDPEKCTRISAESYLDNFVTRAKACFCCPWPACKKQHEVRNGPLKGFKGGNYWAANSVVFGSLIDNDNLDLTLALAGLCNQYGLDMFHVGFTLAWAMECYENGILTKGDTDGLELTFGCKDKEGLSDLVRKIAMKEGLGELLSLGCAEAAKRIGKGSEEFCLAVKGQELEGIGQRNGYMVALGVATSEVGPDHTRWYPPHPGKPALISNEELDSLGVHLDLVKAAQGMNPEDKGKQLRWFSISRAIVESLPSCVFLIRETLGLDLRPWHKLFLAGTGVKLDYQDFLKVGERILNLDRAFIVREGFRRADDRPPFRMVTEDVPKFGYPRLESSLFDKMLDEYYAENGWSLTTSIPTRKKLEELGLNAVVKEFDRLKIEME